jgi:hypothetical protein
VKFINKAVLVLGLGSLIVLFQNCSQWKGNVEIAPSQFEKISGDTAKEIIGDIGADLGVTTTGTGSDINGGDDTGITTTISSGGVTVGSGSVDSSVGSGGDSGQTEGIDGGSSTDTNAVSQINAANGTVSDSDVMKICMGFKSAQPQSVQSLGAGQGTVYKFNGFDVLDVETVDVGYLIAKNSSKGGDRVIVFGDIKKLNEEGIKYTQQGNVLVFIANSDATSFPEIQYIARQTQMKLHFCNFSFRVGHNDANDGSISFFNDFQERTDEDFTTAYMRAFYNKDGLAFNILTVDPNGNFTKVTKSTSLTSFEKILGLKGRWYEFKGGTAQVNIWASFFDFLDLGLRSFLKL